ncbi:methyltransferase-like protein 25B [Microplitis demolitor]|uniref:methyltransferase-like protein 25B n=1 Tax=Microplitis demolitor TaxID=69319 RepID=UPI0004CD8F73|nr:methyltransferase-like protein 25B [Microplitis demolitor]
MLKDFENYFENTINLFDEFQWLFKYPVTKILVENFLNKFPDDWLQVLRQLTTEELNDLVNGKFVNENWPPSLVSFVNKCNIINKLPHPPTLPPKLSEQLPNAFKTGLSQKKQYEILNLAKLINDKCLEYNIQTIVDFGSGLGYIGQLLNYLYDYKVIGLESNLNNVKIAEKRQHSLYPESIEKVKFVNIKITTNDSDEEIKNKIKLLTNDEEFCLIGLHACADLSVTACKLFSKIEMAKLLIIVSCCYHKLEVNDYNKFINFPVSQTLKNVINNSNNNCNYKEILHRPFLRLACQEPANRWDKMSKDLHDKHAFCVLSRAVIELFTYENNITLTKCVRKATRKSQCKNFETYLQDTIERYYFNGNSISNDGDNKKFMETIMKLWESHEDKMNDVEIYTGLQLLLQAPAESLVLYDRYCWLIENNYSSEIVAVLSNVISPRCYATVGIKK